MRALVLAVSVKSGYILGYEIIKYTVLNVIPRYIYLHYKQTQMIKDEQN